MILDKTGISEKNWKLQIRIIGRFCSEHLEKKFSWKSDTRTLIVGLVLRNSNVEAALATATLQVKSGFAFFWFQLLKKCTSFCIFWNCCPKKQFHIWQESENWVRALGVTFFYDFIFRGYIWIAYLLRFCKKFPFWDMFWLQNFFSFTNYVFEKIWSSWLAENLESFEFHFVKLSDRKVKNMKVGQQSFLWFLQTVSSCSKVTYSIKFWDWHWVNSVESFWKSSF